MDNKTIGQLAYEGYRKQRKKRGVDGKKLPSWSHLSLFHQTEWEVAASHVLKFKAEAKGGTNHDE